MPTSRSIAHWNLARFGETLLPLLADDSDKALAIANEALGTYRARYVEALIGGLRRKLGLFTEEEGDAALAQDLLNAMTDGQADFTLTFRRLGDAAADPAADAEVRGLFANKPESFDAWLAALARAPARASRRMAQAGARRCMR